MQLPVPGLAVISHREPEAEGEQPLKKKFLPILFFFLKKKQLSVSSNVPQRVQPTMFC